MKKVWLGCLVGMTLWSYGAIGLASSKYYGQELCAYPEFECVKVKRGDTWAKRFPNEREREMVKRLNRTNSPLHWRPWIVVPINIQDIEYIDLSPFSAQLLDPTGKPQVVVDLTLHAFGAYDAKGVLVHWGPVSGGKGWCKDIDSECNTALGSYRITRKQGPECVSSQFPVETNGGAPMPYCMHYYRGFALHGSNLPGYHASHGCVRLFYDDAQWLNESFIEIGTKITVIRS